MTGVLAVARAHPSVAKLLAEIGNDVDVTELARDLRAGCPLAGIQAHEHEPLVVAPSFGFTRVILRRIDDGRLGTLTIHRGAEDDDHVASAHYAPVRGNIDHIRDTLTARWAPNSEMAMPIATFDDMMAAAVEVDEPRGDVLRRDHLRLAGLLKEIRRVRGSIEDEELRRTIDAFVDALTDPVTA